MSHIQGEETYVSSNNVVQSHKWFQKKHWPKWLSLRGHLVQKWEQINEILRWWVTKDKTVKDVVCNKPWVWWNSNPPRWMNCQGLPVNTHFHSTLLVILLPLFFRVNQIIRSHKELLFITCISFRLFAVFVRAYIILEAFYVIKSNKKIISP